MRAATTTLFRLACNAPQLHCTQPYRRLSYFTNSKYSSGNGKDNNNKQPVAGSLDSQPKPITISKAEYQRMKQFVQALKNSMPLPDLQPPSFDHKSNPLQPPSPLHAAEPPSDSDPHFNTPQQILSFQLIKLSSPQQFLPYFKQHSGHQSPTMPLLVLHRYVAVGGVVGRDSAVGKLAYQSMELLLGRMGHMDENELQEFVGLYLELQHQQAEQGRRLQKGQGYSLTSTEKISLPSYSSSHPLPLIGSPSRRNPALLVLLLQFLQPHPATLAPVLLHYQLLEPELDEDKYPLRDLAYIMAQAWKCQLKDYPAYGMFSKGMETAAGQKVVGACQIVVMNSGKMVHPSAGVLVRMREVEGVMVKAVQRISKLGQQIKEKTQSTSQQQLLVGSESPHDSASLPALLRTCLMVLDQTPGHPLSLLLVSALLTLPLPAQSLPQYCQCWQSTMILHRLLSAKTAPSGFDLNELYKFVDGFIDKCMIGQAVREYLAQGEYADVEEIGRIAQGVFDCLVAYRIVLAPDVRETGPWAHIIREIQQGSSHRHVLKQLLLAHSRLFEKQAQCSLITTPADMHNLIISLMIAQAYPNVDVLPMVVTPAVEAYLEDYGAKHPRFGGYVVKQLGNIKASRQ